MYTRPKLKLDNWFVNMVDDKQQPRHPMRIETGLNGHIARRHPALSNVATPQAWLAVVFKEGDLGTLTKRRTYTDVRTVTGVPATFQRLVDSILRDLRCVYIRERSVKNL